MRPVITACLLFGVTLLLYGYRLTDAPVSPQERQVLVAAASGSGPLFFQVSGEDWLQPGAVYLTAAARHIGGGDASARLATVIVAAINIALVFLCARRVFASRLAGALAPLLLLATPAHIMFGRSGTDALFTIPFVLLWLLALLCHWESGTTGSIIAAGAALGAGVYMNRAAPLTMGFLLMLSVATLIGNGRSWRSVWMIVSAFGAWLLPAAAWFALHQETYPDTFGRWAVFLAHIRNPIDGVRAFVNWNTLGSRASLYWGFLDPAWLFFENMLLLVMLPLLVAGAAMWRRVLTRPSMTLIAGGALVAPLAGSSFGAPHYAQDALAFLPCAILLMSAGIAGLQQWFSAPVRRSGA